jgi:hypothetical protein
MEEIYSSEMVSTYESALDITTQKTSIDLFINMRIANLDSLNSMYKGQCIHRYIKKEFHDAYKEIKRCPVCKLLD